MIGSSKKRITNKAIPDLIRAAKIVTNADTEEKNAGQNASVESRIKLYRSDSKCSEIQGKEKLGEIKKSEMLRGSGALRCALKEG